MRGTVTVAGAALLVLLAGIWRQRHPHSLIGVGFEWLYLMIAYRHRIQLAILAAPGLIASIPFPEYVGTVLRSVAGRRRRPLLNLGHCLGSILRHQKAKWRRDRAVPHCVRRSVSHEPYFAVDAPVALEDAHNLLVSNAVERGIIGLVLVLAAWFFQWRVGSWIGRKSSLFDARIALEAGTLGLFVNAMSLDIMFYKYTWLAFMLAVLVRNAALWEVCSGTPSERRRFSLPRLFDPPTSPNRA